MSMLIEAMIDWWILKNAVDSCRGLTLSLTFCYFLKECTRAELERNNGSLAPSGGAGDPIIWLTACIRFSKDCNTK